MLKRNVWIWCLMASIALLLWGCQRKQAYVLSDNSGHKLHDNHKWSKQQKKFFNIHHSVTKKSFDDVALANPTIIDCSDSTFVRFYNKLVALDSQQNLVAKIAPLVGKPFWRWASILENNQDKSVTFYVPLGFESGDRTEALISALEYEENGVKKYLFKLTERKEIEAVFADEDKMATYNNFGVEAMLFIANDYFVYEDNYTTFVSSIKAHKDAGLDLQSGHNDLMWGLLRDDIPSKFNCNCQLRFGKFLMGGAGNVIKDLGSKLSVKVPSNGLVSTVTGNDTISNDVDLNGNTVHSVPSIFGFVSLFDDGGSGSIRGDDNSEISPLTFGGSIIGFIFWYIHINSNQPVFQDSEIVMGKDISQRIVTQIFIDCGQDGFKPDDLIVGNVEAEIAATRALKVGNLDCSDSRCLIKNSLLFDRVDDFFTHHYINPCTGNELNLDEAIKDAIKMACDADSRQSIDVFENAMQAELDKVVYLNLNDIYIHKSDCRKTDSQNIENFVHFMQDNGGCTQLGFNDALEKYLGISSKRYPPEVVFSATTSMCDNILLVTPCGNDPKNLSTIGLQNLFVSLNSGVFFWYEYLTFDISTPKNCNLTVAEIFTTAFNDAIKIANNNINNDKPIWDGEVEEKFPSIRVAFILMIKKLLEKKGKENRCLAPDVTFSAYPRLPNWPKKGDDCDPVFVDFNKISIKSLCP